MELPAEKKKNNRILAALDNIGDEIHPAKRELIINQLEEDLTHMGDIAISGGRLALLARLLSYNG